MATARRTHELGGENGGGTWTGRAPTVLCISTFRNVDEKSSIADCWSSGWYHKGESLGIASGSISTLAPLHTQTRAGRWASFSPGSCMGVE